MEDVPKITIGTTPTVIIEIEGEVNFNGTESFLATIEQGSLTVNIEAERVAVDGNYVSIELRQQDTLRFREGDAIVQVNWNYPDGTRGAIEQMEIELLPNAYKKVMV